MTAAFVDARERRRAVRAAEHAQDLPLAAFARVVDLKRFRLVCLEEVVGEDAEREPDILDVVHVARHVDVLRADGLLERELVLGKVLREFAERAFAGARGERSCRERERGELDGTALVKVKHARLLIRRGKDSPVQIRKHRVHLGAEAGIGDRERAHQNPVAPARAAEEIDPRLREHPEHAEPLAPGDAVAAERGKAFGEVVLHHQHRLRDAELCGAVDERRRDAPLP